MTAPRHRRPILRVEGLTVALPAGGDREFAVKDLSFYVNCGEILCLTGESGSGKSVAARAIMGLLAHEPLGSPTGKVLLGETNILAQPPAILRGLRSRRMAMIFQEPFSALNPVKPVGKQIEEVLEIHTPLDRRDRILRVESMLKEVGLSPPREFYHSYPHQLSGGQRQRIMIAMALILGPDLLIADEPTTALDVTTQARVLSLIRDLQKRLGVGVLLITHDLAVAAEIADHIVVMRHGRIIEHGAKRELLSSPRQDYTKMLLTSIPGLQPLAAPAVAQRAPPVLAANRLGKTYQGSFRLGSPRKVHALHEATFEIGRGEILGIIGESGSGKSTLARCLLRLTEPTSGRITLMNLDISRLSQRALRPHRRNIQIVFQDPYRSLNPHRTIGHSIIEGPVNFGIKPEKAWAQARKLMEDVSLPPEALDRLPHQFSGGQRQRICIARALALGPAILVADEAVSALDVPVQARISALLADICRRFDLAVIFITHDLRVAARLCHRIMVLHRGSVVETGPTDRIYGAPSHPYTQALLAAAPGRKGLT